jgi:hypothetical protein
MGRMMGIMYLNVLAGKHAGNIYLRGMIFKT